MNPSPSDPRSSNEKVARLRAVFDDRTKEFRRSHSEALFNECERLQRELADTREAYLNQSARLAKTEPLPASLPGRGALVSFACSACGHLQPVSAHEPRPVHTIQTKEYEERANAWHAVFAKMLENNPSFTEGEHTGLQCALNELDRLYGLAQPPPVDEPSVMGGALHPIPPPPTGVDRIEWHVREIQKICDALNLDPVQWLMPDLENDVPEGPSPTKGGNANERP